MRIAAGILMILGGLGVALWVTLARELTDELIPVYPELAFGWWLLGVLSYAPMITAFVGAYYVFKRRRWRLSLAGAICSATGYPFIPGILAIVFLAKRKGDFLYPDTIIQGDERNECVSYYEEEKKLQLLSMRVFQFLSERLGRYEDAYFRARRTHREFWSSMEKICEVNEYQSQVAAEIVDRKRNMKAAPAAAEMSLAWESVYLAYQALHAPENIAAGDPERVAIAKALQKVLANKLDESFRQARKAEKEFLKVLHISSTEYQKIVDSAARSVASDEWLRKLEAECP